MKFLLANTDDERGENDRQVSRDGDKGLGKSPDKP